VMYPKVSVFLPTYNHKLFIREAIEGVLIQNYPNMEIVIGDDCSTDGTQEILKEYKNKYPDLIKLILSEKNTGITQNCNRILNECSGDYIAMFASDDVWLPNKINKQIELFKKNPDAVFCYTKTEVFESETGRTICIFPQFKKIEDYSVYDDILEFTYAIGWSVPSFMFLKKAIPTHGFESSIPNVSDWLFWIETIRNGKVIYIDEVLAKYRRHKNNASKDLFMIFTEHLLTLNLLEKKFNDLSLCVNKKRLSAILGYIHEMYKKNLHNRILQADLSKFSFQLTHLIEQFSQHTNAAKQVLSAENKVDGYQNNRAEMSLDKENQYEKQLQISVVMITYNHEKYIAEAIQSVLDQTYKDFEFIIVNDGSTDRTDEIIRQFEDPRIRYIYQANQGPSAASNSGTIAAKGKYIALFSGDDVCYPHRIERQYEFLRNSEYKIIFSWCDIIDDSSRIVAQEETTARNVFNHPNRNQAQMLNYFFYFGNYINAVTTMAERSIILEQGGWHLTSLQVQDWDMWIKLAKKYELYIMPERLIKYRIRDENKNLSTSPENYIRCIFEQYQISKSIFDNISIDLFKEAFSDKIKNNNFSQMAEFELEKAFLYLTHRQALIQSIGVEKLFNLLQNEDVLSVAKTKYDFDLPALYKLTKNVDIANTRYCNHLAYQNEYLKQQLEVKNKEVQKLYSQINRTQIEALYKPTVSVCIPTYNGEKFLSDALSSVLSQTYVHIEIIISDDGSTDRTLDIVKSFQNQTSKEFIVILHRNYGLVSNWNFCIQHAKGKYIKFLHQEDVLEPFCIKELVSIAEQDDEIGLVFSVRGVLSSGGTKHDPSCISEPHISEIDNAWTGYQTIQSGQKLLEDPNLFNWTINKFGEPTTVLIRKEVFDNIGGFDPELRQLVDVEMWLRIMSQYKIGFADKVLSQWRIHPEQQTRRNARERQTISADWQKFYDKIAKDSRYPEKVRQDAMQRLLAMTPQQDNPRHIRKHLSESWLKVPSELLEKAYSGDMGNVHRRLTESNLRNEALTQEETAFLQHLIAELTKRSATDPVSAINYLLAAMLYLPSGRLKIENARASLPGWLIGDYERFFLKLRELCD